MDETNKHPWMSWTVHKAELSDLVKNEKSQDPDILDTKCQSMTQFIEDDYGMIARDKIYCRVD